MVADHANGRFGWEADSGCETVGPMDLRPRHFCGAITASITLLAIGACDRRVPTMSEKELAEIQEFAPGITAECIEKARFGGISAISSDAVEQCFEMSEARSWRGFWQNDFEGSRFCPEPMKECAYDTPGDNIWLSYAEGVETPPSWPEVGAGGMYEVEFIGRLTAKRGHYGHMGASDHELVIDRVISIRILLSPEI